MTSQPRNGSDNAPPVRALDNSNVAIRVNNLGKMYRIYNRPQDRLKQMLFARFGKTYGQEFWALHGVSFEVRKGESLGIIGRNGSGKSTLLQMIASTLDPTEGSAEVHGRVAALLELGSGFNPEFTGRENVYLNGAILGISRSETTKRFGDIEEFADIGEFIDQPIKTYSSGMLMRLAFAVQVGIDPDILIVDEALSVGDVFFSQKCLRRMMELQAKGTTVLFVSHDMSIVRDLCKQALYLRNGQTMFFGASERAISRYFQSNQIEPIKEAGVIFPPETPVSTDVVEQFKSKALWVHSSPMLGDEKEASIIAVAVLDELNRPSTDVIMGGSLKFHLLFKVKEPYPVHAKLVLKNRYEQVIFCGGSYPSGLEPLRLLPGSFPLFEITIVCMIEAGRYTFQMGLGLDDQESNRGVSLDQTPWLGPITVKWDYETQKAPFLGMFGLPSTPAFRLLSQV
jgi:lipopolysaccharide transport system ATP-binding protein